VERPAEFQRFRPDMGALCRSCPEVVLDGPCENSFNQLVIVRTSHLIFSDGVWVTFAKIFHNLI
jgi:hypothetical protein